MASVSMVDMSNKKVKDVELPALFGAEVKSHLLHSAVVNQLANRRAGTAATKTKGLVSGGGKKPFKQKGTGRARAGSSRSPLWRHGGTVFGPQPRDYSYSMPKKARAAALRAALSQRVREGALKVVEGLTVEQPKTKLLKGLLAQLGIVGKAVLVEHEPADALVLSGRNLPGVRVVADSHLTAYDVMDCKHLLLTPEALGKLAERLAPRARE